MSASTRNLPILLMLVSLWPRSAWSEEQIGEELNDEARAAQLFALGDRAAQSGDLDGAVQALTESHAIFPQPGTLANLAHYQDQLGRFVESYYLWQELLEQYGQVISDPARERARSRIEVLESALARVVLLTEPPGATVSIDGHDRGRTPLDGPLLLNPGVHRLEAALEGYQRATEIRGLQAGLEQEITLTLTPSPEEPSDPPEPEAEPDPETSPVPIVEPCPEPMVEPCPEPERCPEPEPPLSRGRRFWRSPWTWLVTGILIGGASAAGIAVGVTRESGYQADIRLP